MTSVTAVVIVVVAASVVTAVLAVLVAALRVRRAYREVVASLASVRPVLDELAERQLVMRDEVARVSASIDRLSASRRRTKCRTRETV